MLDTIFTGHGLVSIILYQKVLQYTGNTCLKSVSKKLKWRHQQGRSLLQCLTLPMSAASENVPPWIMNPIVSLSWCIGMKLEENAKACKKEDYCELLLMSRDSFRRKHPGLLITGVLASWWYLNIQITHVSNVDDNWPNRMGKFWEIRHLPLSYFHWNCY